MITTEFQDMNQPDQPSYVVQMPHPVSEGDFVDLDDYSFRVLRRCWVVNSYTGAVKLKVKMR